MSKRGLFIVFEGLDRCGKTSQCENLVNFLKESGKKAIMKRYPDRTTTIGQTINNYLQGKQNLSDQAIHLIFSANRWEQQEEIKKILDEGTNIVCDRYCYSGAVYTSAKGYDIEWCKNPDKGLIKPDIVLYLHAPKEVISKRSGFGGEVYEKEEFQQKVREAFDNLLQKEDNVVFIDASGTKEEVFDLINQNIKKVFEDASTKDQKISHLWI
ncbi:thymidylate kinase (macronuclear) [Tetrahymena thermophila SB210]|uniref:Thymidylate kinase n=1 Tax=Tetrahymena thermophila (strain SB210) TaxID=312017 RepID=Q22U70_TETTS|nr:thymidylate kinase [Tetrahymena thermophila SB210]EAR88817.1 thymidylate kinase [Tetrahymena thermophila SB210]|eukprot:XP_001009062.1 thymidylate kinase [Tetrahymena thermophila SB210]